MIDPAARFRIGLVTPWPPQPSGIADYAYDLCADLRDAGALPTVFVRPEEEAPRLLDGVEIVDLRALGSAAERFAAQDLLLYQMGNSPRFHGWMLPLLQKHPGVVHLHDMVLHHLVAALTAGEHADAAYLATLARWYGDEAARWAARAILDGPVPWHTGHVTDLPLAEEILRFASACVVHSDFAYARLVPRLPRLPFLRMRQRYRMSRRPAPPRAPATPLSAAVFGDVVPHKHVDMVVRAVAAARRAGGDVRLDIVGAPDDHIGRAIEALGLQDAVRIHGRVGEAEFLAALARADICIAWRDPTMGETSGVVSRALQLGVPLIVHRVGWYAELPDAVIKIEGHDAERRLARLLHALATDRAALGRLTEEAGVLADASAAGDRTIEGLLAFLRSVASGAELLDPGGLARAAAALAALGIDAAAEDAVLRRQALDRVGPVVGYVTIPDPFRDIPLFSGGA
jgi:glycosyltransferase involved in cell wall biosynthesis